MTQAYDSKYLLHEQSQVCRASCDPSSTFPNIVFRT